MMFAIKEVSDYICHVMFFILYNFYILVHGERIAQDAVDDFYFPEEQTFAMFETDDVNVNRIVALARFHNMDRIRQLKGRQIYFP